MFLSNADVLEQRCVDTNSAVGKPVQSYTNAICMDLIDYHTLLVLLISITLIAHWLSINCQFNYSLVAYWLSIYCQSIIVNSITSFNR